MPTENQAAGPERAALDPAALRAAVVRPGGLWRSVEVTPVTGSTNADLLDFYDKLPNGDRQFVILPHVAHSVTESNNRHMAFHVIQAFLSMPPQVAS